MALKGTCKTNDYNGRYLMLEWTAAQDYYWNISTITWVLRSAGASQYNTYQAGNFKAIIDGEVVYSSSARISIGENTVIASGTKTISHNADGARSFSISIEGGIYYVAVNCRGSANYTLDKIIRAANIVSSHSFTDEENLTVTYSNPGGNNVTKLQAQIANDNKVLIIKDINKTATSYTFNFTEAERDILRAEVKRGINEVFSISIVTTIGSNVYTSTENRSFSIVNALPSMVATVYDGGTISKTLTGDINTMIKGYNTMYCNIEATGNKGATITSYEITNGNITKNTSSATFGYSYNNTFTFTVTDSRFNTATQTIVLPMVEYTPLTTKFDGKISLNEEEDTTAEIEFTISGDFFDGTFGAQDNEITISYEIIDADTQLEVDSGTIPMEDIIVEEGKYKITYLANAGFDYRSNYLVKATVADKINSLPMTSHLLKAIPVFDWSKEDFNFNVPVSIDGYPITDYVIATGTEAMGSNGTWYWAKWKSGKAECYGCRNYGNMAVSSAWGSLFLSTTFSQDLPSGLFVETPQFMDIRIINSGSGAGWIVTENNTGASKTSTGKFAVCRATSYNIQQAYIGFHIIGKWY